jgi:hypothetical protein
MDIETALEAIPEGWRLYTIDMSIINRASVTLKQIDRIGYVNAVAPTLAGAIAEASAKAKWHYRGWNIAPEYIGYSATHPDHEASYEGPEDGWVGNGLCVHGMTVEQVKAEIDDVMDDRGML